MEVVTARPMPPRVVARVCLEPMQAARAYLFARSVAQANILAQVLPTRVSFVILENIRLKAEQAHACCVPLGKPRLLARARARNVR